MTNFRWGLVTFLIKLLKRIIVNLYALLLIIQTSPSFSHTLSDREKHFRETTVTTVEDYVRYLSGDNLEDFENLSCLHIKLDYINMLNRVIDDEEIFAGVSYYYKDDLIYFNRMFSSITEREFNTEVVDVRRMLESGNESRGNIPDDSLYLGALSRLFSEYWIGMSSFTEEIDLRGKRKCKDYKFHDHD